MNSNTVNLICEQTYNLFQYFCVCIQYIWLLCYLLEWTCFALLIFLVNLQYFSPLLQDLIVVLNENLSQSFALVLFSIIQNSLDYI